MNSTGLFFNALYLSLLAVVLGVSLLKGRRVFSRGPVFAFVVALCVSWIPMQLIARLLEQRSMLSPSEQFQSFYWGDLILLPLALAGLTVLAKDMPTTGWHSGTGWQATAVLIGIAVGVGFHLIDQGNYTAMALNSPTKLWHDIVAFPVLTYLLVLQSPALVYSRSGSKTVKAVLIAICLVSFGYLALIYDAKHPGTDAHRDYDWNRLRTVNQ